MVIFFIIICGIYIGVQFWQIYHLFIYQAPIETNQKAYPRILIMVAARNEENNIRDCLNALINQNYPKNLFKIRVGDDQSTDKTKEIILEFRDKYPNNIEYVGIKEKEDGLKAKARVMAQLDAVNDADYYFITDADVVVNANWLEYMVNCFNTETGIISGTTVVEGDNLFAKLQGIDWTYFMGLLNVISYSGVPATAVGNNMAIKTKAYWDTGGYGKITFSITEDYKLYSEVCKKGWKWNNIMHPHSLAFSKSTSGFFSLLHQRKRWLSGGKALPWYWWLLFIVFALFYPMVGMVMTHNFLLGLFILILKWVLQSYQIQKITSYCELKKFSIVHLIYYELYLFAVTIATALFFILPFPTIWKQRRY